MHDRQELLALVEAMRTHLEWWRDTGVEFVATSVRANDRAVDAPTATPVAEPATAIPKDAPAMSGNELDEKRARDAALRDLLTEPAVGAAASLPELRSVIGDCQRCKLAPHRTQLVFGVGNPRAELVFVGEAPGRDEDLRGEPFVGRAGQLLTEIIVKGMKLQREDVYIANIIKCRPPQNRNPEPDEIASCEPFLIKQLALIQPKAIVALGTFAAQALLKTRTPITRLRGTWADYQGIPLMPTFHPAYLLRNPGEKRLVWQDIQQVMARLGLR